MQDMPAAPSRRLDHLVLPARDLEAQAAFCKRLGFQIGGRNIHPWGTENRLIQFDGTFLELVSVSDGASPPDHGPRAFSFGAHVRDFLARDEVGLSMLVTGTDDAAADAKWRRQAGIGDFEPFRFGRKGTRADGSETEVSFTLSFAAAASMPDLSFFSCQHHFPENFWQPALQLHENGSAGVSELLIVANDPLASVGFLKAFFGGGPVFANDMLTSRLGSANIMVATPDRAISLFGEDPALLLGGRPHFGALTVSVRDIAKVADRLLAEEVPHHHHGNLVVVPSGAGLGLVIAFAPAEA
ncbi:MAG: VOC family protein [Beijerinckiaceae bacterium]